MSEAEYSTNLILNRLLRDLSFDFHMLSSFMHSLVIKGHSGLFQVDEVITFITMMLTKILFGEYHEEVCHNFVSTNVFWSF